jgi:transposase-like protein
VLRRFGAAGVTVDEFCRDEGLSRSSFNRWRSRLQARPGGAPIAHSSADQTPDSSASSAPSPFVDLGLLSTANAMVRTAPTPPPMLDLRLDLGGGVVLHLQRR